MGSVTEEPTQASAEPGLTWTWRMEQRHYYQRLSISWSGVTFMKVLLGSGEWTEAAWLGSLPGRRSRVAELEGALT